MARTPDGAAAREVSMTTRITHEVERTVDSQRAYRGGMSRSAYVRWLIAEDGKKIARERGAS